MFKLNKDYHGNGYGYEAAKAIIDYLFNEKGAQRIYAYTEDYNIASESTMAIADRIYRMEGGRMYEQCGK